MLSHLLPKMLCKICHQHPVKHKPVCTSCKNYFTVIGAKCKQCANPLNDSDLGKTDSLCGKCIQQQHSFDSVYCKYVFQPPLQNLVHAFKYHHNLYLTNYLASLIIESMQDAKKPDLLIPVPMHAKNIKSRGFNPSAQLAKYIAKQLKVPVRLNLCQKLKYTPSQAKLGAKERQKNLKNAFSASKIIEARHIAIVDDVVTTASTVNMMAKELKRQGASKVDVFCIARAIQ